MSSKRYTYYLEIHIQLNVKLFEVLHLISSQFVGIEGRSRSVIGNVTQ